jgi:hypothetical protein
VLPEREYIGVLRETVVENRTVELRERRLAVNPGIAPSIIAAAVGRPIRSFEIHPHVLAGTARIPGATEVRAEELRGGRANFRESLRETPQEIRPAARISQPQPLGRNEQGRLGDNPPRAASTRPGETQPPAQPGTQGRGNVQPPPQPGTQGLSPRDQREPNPPSARPQEQRQPPVQQPSPEPRT